MNEASAVALATRTNGEDVNFLAVVGAHEAEGSADLLDGFGLDGIVQLVDQDSAVWNHFEVFSQPAMVFIDTDGSYERHTGQLGPWDLQDRIDELGAIQR